MHTGPLRAILPPIALLTAPAIALASSGPEPARLVATPAPRLLLVVFTPPSAGARASSSEVFATAEEVFREATRIAVVSPEQVGLTASELDKCPLKTRLTCWLKHALRANAGRALSLLSIAPIGDRDRVNLLSFDLDRAARALDELASKGVADPEAIEAEVFQLAVRSPAESVPSNGLAAFLRARVGGELGAFLRSLAPAANGSVRIEGLAPGTVIEIDGRSLGRAASPSAIVEAIEPGEHEVALAHPDGRRELITLEVDPMIPARIVAGASLPPPSSHAGTILSIGGGALTLAGAATLIASAVTAGETSALCLHRGDPTLCEPPAPEFRRDPGAVATPDGSAGVSSAVVIGIGAIAVGAAALVIGLVADL